MALEVSEKPDTAITERTAKEIQKSKMIKTDIREAIPSSDQRINLLSGENR